MTATETEAKAVAEEKRAAVLVVQMTVAGLDIGGVEVERKAKAVGTSVAVAEQPSQGRLTAVVEAAAKGAEPKYAEQLRQLGLRLHLETESNQQALGQRMKVFSGGVREVAEVRVAAANPFLSCCVRQVRVDGWCVIMIVCRRPLVEKTEGPCNRE